MARTNPRYYSPPLFPTAIVSSPLRGGSVSETGVGCLERLPVSTKDSNREGGLGLAWRPTGPDRTPHITPAPIYVGWGRESVLLSAVLPGRLVHITLFYVFSRYK